MIEQEIRTTDITERESGAIIGQSFEKLIDEVEEYAILLLDVNGKIISWNKGAEKIKGYTSKEIIGQSFKVFYPKEDLATGLPDSLLDQARANGKVVHEGWRVRKTGHRFWGSVTITALHDTRGAVTGFLKLTKDLTEKKISEDRYDNMLEELRLKIASLKSEEERYHKMVSEVRDYAIILLDPEGNVIDWNKGAEFLKGYQASEIIGKNFRLFYPQEDKNQNLPEALLKQAITNGSANHEGYRIKKDGTRFWGSIAITALYDDNKKLIGFSKVTKDLTERKAAEDRIVASSQQLQQANEELRQSEERYHKMISEVQDYAILLLDSEGKIQNWNAGAQLIKGYTSDEVIGKSFHVFYFSEDVRNGLPDRLLNEARTNGRARHEGWRKRKDGSRFWASVVITALHGSHGQVIGFSKVTRDLTDKKAAEDIQLEHTRQLQINNRELEMLNSELSSFAYVVSHDFKEPIRKIQVFAHRQKEKDKTIDQILDFSDKIILSAKRMQKLMESLLSYSSISNDDSSTENVDLNEILNAVKIDLELLIQEREAEISSEDLPTIKGVPFQLHQLFLNLISNSIKFGHPDRAPKVNIGWSRVRQSELPEELAVHGRDYISLNFTDNGVGFTEAQSSKIFEVFKRLGPRDAQGTGIGLAIVKKVASNHRGYVSAQGTPGEGSQFQVLLPNE